MEYKGLQLRFLHAVSNHLCNYEWSPVLLAVSLQHPARETDCFESQKQIINIENPYAACDNSCYLPILAI